MMLVICVVVEGRFIAAEIRRIIDEQVLVWDKALRSSAWTAFDIAIICPYGCADDTYIEELLEARRSGCQHRRRSLCSKLGCKMTSVLLRFCSDPRRTTSRSLHYFAGRSLRSTTLTLYKLAKIGTRTKPGGICWFRRDHSNIWSGPANIFSGCSRAAGTPPPPKRSSSSRTK